MPGQFGPHRRRLRRGPGLQHRGSKARKVQLDDLGVSRPVVRRHGQEQVGGGAVGENRLPGVTQGLGDCDRECVLRRECIELVAERA